MSRLLNTASSPERQVTDDRQACWVAKLLEDRSFRTSQLERLDAELDASSDPAANAVTGLLWAGAYAALKDIDDALARLASGQFGRCVSCDQPIELERLDVLPMTPQCMPCHYDAEISGR